MSRPILAVDFDDVLFPFMATFVPHYNETFGVNYHIDDYWCFEFDQVWQEEKAIAWPRIAAFFDMPHIDLDPVPGAVEGVDALAEKYELVIVTARDESLRPNTESWLDRHLPGRFSHVYLCNSYTINNDLPQRHKPDVVEEIGAVALIDDSLRNVTEVAQQGREGLLFGDFAWNRSDSLPEGVSRHLGWSSIIERFAA